MANIDKLIPVLLKWEASTVVKAGESLESAFNRAKKTGWANDPADTGGATMVGITLNTYKTYCKNKGLKTPTSADLKNITFAQWKDIVYSMYWNKWRADEIENQLAANMVVDWVWHSGVGTIKKVLALLNVTQDGSVGPKTIAALNAEKDIASKVYNARKAYFEAIVRNNPSLKKWFNGWMNRLNDVYKS